MKKILSITFTAILFLCLFASSFCAFAMGFDAEEVYESVFVIETDEAIGSGFAVGENSIITNAHVIEDARYITVKTYGGESYTASVYASDYELDVALLVVEDVSLTPLPAADVSSAKIGDDIYTIGSPKGLSYTLTTGAISAKNRELDGYYYIQIDAPINTGNSGGPLLNDNGEVLGINTLKIMNSEGIGFAIPIFTAVEFLEGCGITFDEKGNVLGTLEAPEIDLFPDTETDTDTGSPEQPVPETPENSVPDPGSSKPGSVIIIDANRTEIAILTIALVASVAVNLGLIIYIIRKKRSAQKAEPIEITIDPSERTDFEIEFME